MHTPPRHPQVNVIAERWIRSARQAWLDHLLILNERRLRRVLTDYIAFYNGRRPPGIGPTVSDPAAPCAKRWANPAAGRAWWHHPWLSPSSCLTGPFSAPTPCRAVDVPLGVQSRSIGGRQPIAGVPTYRHDDHDARPPVAGKRRCRSGRERSAAPAACEHPSYFRANQASTSYHIDTSRSPSASQRSTIARSVGVGVRLKMP